MFAMDLAPEINLIGNNLSKCKIRLSVGLMFMLCCYRGMQRRLLTGGEVNCPGSIA